MQVSDITHDTTGYLINQDCISASSPEMCPNTWNYFDENNEWNIDAELHVECGMF